MIIPFNRPTTQEQADAEIARLVGIMADALTAMDENRYGDARRLLRTGKTDPVKSQTLVLAKPGIA